MKLGKKFFFMTERNPEAKFNYTRYVSIQKKFDYTLLAGWARPLGRISFGGGVGAVEDRR